MDPDWWKRVLVFYSEENHETSIIQDDVSVVKSICEYHTGPFVAIPI